MEKSETNLICTEHNKVACSIFEERFKYKNDKVFLSGERAAEKKCNFDIFMEKSSLERVRNQDIKWERPTVFWEKTAPKLREWIWQDYNNKNITVP